MYKVEFKTFAGALQHTLTTEIIDIAFSPLELESEVSGFRTPQSAIIALKKTTWVTNNILKAPKTNIADRQILKYKIEISWTDDGGSTYTLLNTMFVLMDLFSDRTDSEIAELRCYDSTKLLEIYSDKEYNNPSLNVRLAINTVLEDYYDTINDGTGMLLSTSSIETPTIQSSGSRLIGNFNFYPEDDISINNRLLSVTDYGEMRDLLKDSDITAPMIAESVNTYAKRIDIVKIGFSTTPPQAEAYPTFRVVALSVWQLRHPDTSHTGLGWVKRPYYIAALTVWEYRVFNYVAYELVNKQEFKSKWAYAGGKIVDQILWGVANAYKFSVLRNTQFGRDRNEVLSEQGWVQLVQQYNLYHQDHVGGTYVANSARFISTFTAVFGSNKDCNEPMGGNLTCFPNGFTTNINLLQSVNLNRSQGRHIPYTFNLPNGNQNALSAIRNMLYVRNQTLYSNADGTIAIANKTREIDLASPTTITNANILHMSKLHEGVMPADTRTISSLFGNLTVLTEILGALLKTWRVNRKVSLITNTTDNDLLDEVNIADQFAGYISSITTDKMRGKSEIIVNVVDVASVEFTVSDAVTGAIEGAAVALAYNNTIYAGKFTDSAGKAIFFNIPLGVLDYAIARSGYTMIIDSVDINDEIPFFVNKTMSQSLVTPPTITPLLSTGQPTLIELISEDNHAIYYTTDGTDPIPLDPATTLYTEPFYIFATKTIKAITVNSLDNESAVTTEADVASDPVLVAPTISQRLDVNERDDAVVSIEHPDPKAVLRYTLDGTEPNATSKEFMEPILVPKAFKQKVRAKAFFASVISDETEYYEGIADRPHDRVTIIEDVLVPSPTTETVNISMPIATYGFRVTVVMNMYVREIIGALDVEVIMGAVRQFECKAGTLNINNDGGFFQDYFTNDEFYGTIFRYENGVITDTNQLNRSTADLMPVVMNMTFISGQFVLGVSIENTLTNLASTCTDLTDADVNCRIVVEPFRLDIPNIPEGVITFDETFDITFR